MHEATAQPGPVEDEREVRRPARPGRGLLGLLVLAAALPALLTAAAELWRLDEPTLPHADYAVLELHTSAAAEGEQLLGPYSRFGWSHPGPAMFYALAPSFVATGSDTHGMTLGASLVNALALAACVLVAGRAGGRLAAVGTAAALAILLLAWGPGHVASFWNPHLALLPLTLYLLSAAAVATGYAIALPVAVASGSFVAQTHIGLAPTVAAVAAAVAVAWAVPRSRPRCRLGWGAIVGAVAVGALLWLPVAVEQATRDPGNVSQLAEYLRQERQGTSAGDALLAVAAVGLSPDNDVFDDRRSRSTPLVAGYAAQLLLLGAATAAAVWSRRRFVAALGVTALVGHLSALAAGTAIEGTLFLYLVQWASALLPITWLAIAGGLGGLAADRWSASEHWKPSPRLAIAAPLAGALVVAAVAGVRFNRPLVESGTDLPEVATISEALRPLAPAGASVLVRIEDLEQWPVAAGVLVQLARAGVDVAVEEEWEFMFGERLTAERGEQPTISFASPVPGPRANGTDRTRREIITVDGTVVSLLDP